MVTTQEQRETRVTPGGQRLRCHIGWRTVLVTEAATRDHPDPPTSPTNHKNTITTNENALSDSALLPIEVSR